MATVCVTRFITSAVVLSQAGAGLSSVWDLMGSNVIPLPVPVPHRAPRHSTYCFADMYFFQRREKLSVIFLLLFFFCLMDFLFLIQLKGSEILALD